MTEPDLTDVLDEAEIELINRLRGYTEEGAPIGDGWSVMLSFKAGRWHVDHHHPGEVVCDRSIGEGRSFPEAWEDQTVPELRDGSLPLVTDGERQAARPRLQVIRGGKD